MIPIESFPYFGEAGSSLSLNDLVTQVILLRSPWVGAKIEVPGKVFRTYSKMSELAVWSCHVLR